MGDAAWFYRSYWNDEHKFINFLRKKLPVIPGGGGSGFITALTTTGTSGPATVIANTLNIPIYTSAATGGIDDVLALAQALTTDRGINFSSHKLTLTTPKINYVNPQNLVHEVTNPGPNGYVFIRLYTDRVTNPVPWDLTVQNTAGDLTTVMGWNEDSSVIGAQPSWTTRIEYQYLGSLYEYHVQWSSDNTLARLYRIQSFTFQDTGAAATDSCVWFNQVTDFYLRSYANFDYFNVHWAQGTGTATMAIVSSGGYGAAHYADQPNGRYTIAGGLSGVYGDFYIQDWNSLIFYHGDHNLQWVFSQDTGPTTFFASHNNYAAGGSAIKAFNNASTYIGFVMKGSGAGGDAEIVSDAAAVQLIMTHSGASGFYIYNVNIGYCAQYTSTGSVLFNQYGSGTFTGTVTKTLGVTSAGAIIELPWSGSQITLQYTTTPPDMTPQIVFKNQAGGTIGYIRLDSQTNGSVFMGSDAGLISTGQFNTAIGYHTMNANATGVRNTIIGAGAAQNTTSNFNNCIVLGLDSMDTDVIACGSQNIVIGNNSIDNGEAFGSWNIVLGTTNNNSTGHTVGDFNIIIGNSIGVDAITNTVIISPTGTGAGNLTFSNVFVLGDHTHSVLIGQNPASWANSGASRLNIAASTTSLAQIFLTTGAAPSSPVDGQIWREDNTNTGLKYRVNGVTKTITLS